jgi:DNA polymerase-3 subunit beta
MSFHCEIGAAHLLPAMQAVSKCVYKAQTIPILGHCWMRFHDGRLLVTSTNLDQSITASAECGGGSGEVTIPLSRILAFANLIPSNFDVSLKTDGEHELKLIAKAGRSIHKMPTLPVADFPSSVSEPLRIGMEWQVPTGELLRSVKALSPAMSSEKSRIYWQCIAFAYGQQPALAAMQGHILGEDAFNLPHKENGIFLVPDVTVGMLSALEKSEIVTVRLSKDGHAVSFEASNITIRSKLVDGQYTDYRKIIPAEPKIAFRANAKEFVHALRLGANVPEASGAGDVPKVGTKISFTDGMMHISARTTNGEETSSECDIELVRGKPEEFGAAFSYLLWAVESLESKGDVEFAYSPKGPILITASDAEGSIRLISPRST